MPNKNNNNGARAETREIPMLTLRAAFAPSTFNAENRTVELVWTTGAKGLRRGWDGEYYEELEVSESAIRMERLNNGAPLLAAHDAYSLRGVVGVVVRAWIAKGEGRAVVRFSERGEAAEIMRDVQAGILQNISVGYAVHKYERIRSIGSDGKPDGGIDTYRAIDWEPMEISIVPIGFDDGAKVRSERPKTHACTIITRPGRTIMPTKNRTTTDDQTADQIDEPGDNVSEPVTRADCAAVRAERNRTATILDLVSRAQLGDDFAAELIRSGVPLAEARIAIIDEMAHVQKRTQPEIRGHRVELGNDYSSPEFLAKTIGDAIHARVNPRHTPSDAARPYVQRSFAELARECLHARGVSTRLMGPSTVIERALGGLHGTSDFPAALGDAVGRELLRAFEDAEPGVIRTGRAVTANDFRNRYPIRIGDAPGLEKVNEHGEFKRGTIIEASQPAWKLDTFGKIFGITRQALINDDIGAFTSLPRKFGNAARELENQLAITLLTSNSGVGPTMGDGVALFHANHSNLAASGGAPSVVTLGAARSAMRLQKNIDNRVVNFTPKFLLIPAALETSAEQLLATIAATKTSDVNPFSGKLELIVDPRLDAISSTRWYVVADPARHDGLEFAHLVGEGGPVVDTRTGFDTDGVEFKVRLDYGIGFIEHRSWYANPGA